MPAAKMTRDEALDRITEVFRSRGYEGASLRLISEATGLGRASLYHHFPGGKEEMAQAVFVHIGDRVSRDLVAPLSGPGTPRERLERHARGVARLYEDGARNCLLGAMVLGGGAKLFATQIEGQIRGWIGVLSGVAIEDGVPADLARDRATDVVARIQGALIVSRGLGSTDHFHRVLEELPDTVLGGS